jgi:hypothetical protein
MAFPWHVKGGKWQSLSAWVMFIVLLAGFFAACTLAVLDAMELRKHPIIATYFDAKRNFTLPDIQVCLLQPADQGVRVSVPTSTGFYTTRTANTRRNKGGGDGLLPPAYNITINTMYAGAEYFDSADGTSQQYLDYLASCPPVVEQDTFRKKDNFQRFTYKRKSNLSDSVVNDVPYLYKEYTGIVTPGVDTIPSLDFSAYISPPGDVSTTQEPDSPFGTVDIIAPTSAAIMVGVDPDIACLTFFLSLCPAQRQDLNRAFSPAFILGLNGSSRLNLTDLLISVGQVPLQDPLDTSAILYENNLYQKVVKDSSSEFTFLQHIVKPIRNYFKSQSADDSDFSLSSYTLGALLPASSSVNVATGPQQGGVTPFELNLTISISSKGIEFQLEQDPLLRLFAIFGGYWSLVPLFFGFIYLTKDAPAEVNGVILWLINGVKSCQWVPKSKADTYGTASKQLSTGKDGFADLSTKEGMGDFKVG